MIHLITVTGKSARTFYLAQECISDFKALMSTIVSGKVVLVSTKFRSDLFYRAEKSENESIFKLWALYANTSQTNLDAKEYTTYSGDQKSLSNYFQSINKLSANWHQYELYRKTFSETFSKDQQNPMGRTVVQCDQYLTEHPSIKRTPLIQFKEKINSEIIKDTFSLAMHIINNETHSN